MFGSGAATDCARGAELLVSPARGAGNARIETVGQSQSCMVSKLPIVAQRARDSAIRAAHERRPSPRLRSRMARREMGAFRRNRDGGAELPRQHGYLRFNITQLSAGRARALPRCNLRGRLIVWYIRAVTVW